MVKMFSQMFTTVCLSPGLLLHSAGTWAPWAPRWCVTTSLVWWTSNANSAASTQKWCRPSGPGWRTGSQSASTNSATTAGTATPRPGITTCLDACCYAVSAVRTGRGALILFKSIENIFCFLSLSWKIWDSREELFLIYRIWNVQVATCLLKWTPVLFCGWPLTLQYDKREKKFCGVNK